MRTSVTALLVPAFVAACDGTALDDTLLKDAPLDCGNFSSSLTTQDSMQQPAGIFVSGETVTLRARVTNDSDTAQTLSGNACPFVSFEVRNESAEAVWGWGSDTLNVPLMSCVGTHTFAPGETVDHAIDWNQHSYGNTQVPPGQYTVALLDSTECRSTLSKSIGFEIQ